MNIGKSEQFNSIINKLKNFLSMIEDEEIQLRLKKTYKELESINKHNLIQIDDSQQVQMFKYDDLNGLTIEIINSNIGLKENISLCINLNKNIRGSIIESLNKLNQEEPQGLLNIIKRKKLKDQRKELLDELYAPGVSQSWSTLVIDVSRTETDGNVFCSITKELKEKIYDYNQNSEVKKQIEQFRFKNGVQISDNDPEIKNFMQ